MKNLTNKQLIEEQRRSIRQAKEMRGVFKKFNKAAEQSGIEIGRFFKVRQPPPST